MDLRPESIILMASLKGSLTFGREERYEGSSSSSGLGSFFSGWFSDGSSRNSTVSVESSRDIWSDVQPWEFGSGAGHSGSPSGPTTHGELGGYSTNNSPKVSSSILRSSVSRSYTSALEDLKVFGLLNPNTDPNELLILLDLEKSRRLVWDLGYMCQRAEWGMATAKRYGIETKAGVILALHDSIKQSFPVVSSVFERYNIKPIITSGSLDHPSKDDPKSTSSHRPGRGTDWRFNSETTGVQNLEQRRALMDKVVVDIYQELSKNKHVIFRVLSEHWPDERYDHIHIDTLDGRNKKSGPGSFLFDRTTTPPTFIRLPRPPNYAKKGTSLSEEEKPDIVNSEASSYTPEEFQNNLETNLESGAIVLCLAEKLGNYMVDNSVDLEIKESLIKTIKVNIDAIQNQLDETDNAIKAIKRGE